MFYTYIVTNRRNGTLYTGHTDDIERRPYEHKQGFRSRFASKYNCHKLVWYEEHETRQAAFVRERRIKKWNRAWKLRLIEEDNPHWLDILECPVWPLPKGEMFADLRNSAIQAQSGSPPSRG